MAVAASGAAKKDPRIGKRKPEPQLEAITDVQERRKQLLNEDGGYWRQRMAAEEAAAQQQRQLLEAAATDAEVRIARTLIAGTRHTFRLWKALNL